MPSRTYVETALAAVDAAIAQLRSELAALEAMRHSALMAMQQRDATSELPGVGGGAEDDHSNRSSRRASSKSRSGGLAAKPNPFQGKGDESLHNQAEAQGAVPSRPIAEAPRRGSMRDRLLTSLVSSGRPMAVSEIAAMIEPGADSKKRTTIRKTLDRMLALGEVERVSPGIYRAVRANFGRPGAISAA